MDSEFDLVLRCIKCAHQKVDHDTNSSIDKMKCLIGNCNCMTFVPDRKYYRQSKR